MGNTKKQRIIEALNRMLEETECTSPHDRVAMLAYNIAQDTGGIGLYDYDGKVFFKSVEEGTREYRACGKVYKPARIELRY